MRVRPHFTAPTAPRFGVGSPQTEWTVAEGVSDLTVHRVCVSLDLDGAEWRIPAARMKMREQHIVPLSSQAVSLLRELQPLTGSGRFLFPSLRTNERPISNNTLNAALRRLGYSGDEMVSHGFRSMASTCLNEQGWHPDLIELQLAHAERNEVRAAYNRAQRLDERRKMMQGWAGYLDSLRSGGKVILLRAASAM